MQKKDEEYGDAMYRCLHILQGDIVAIVDAAGNTVVEYKYNARGKAIDESGSRWVLWVV